MNPAQATRIKNVLKWFTKDSQAIDTKIKELEGKKICFVFGANAAGIHGAGSAYDARHEWGAKLKQIHRTGDAYGLVTVDKKIANPVSDEVLVNEFKLLRECMLAEPDTIFLVTKVGTGLGGQPPKKIKDMLTKALEGLDNYIGPEDWNMFWVKKVTNEKRN